MATPIESTDDVEALRVVRNSCKAGFAHDNAYISQAVQRAWWVAMRGRVRGWLYWLDVEAFAAVLIGYGLLRQTEDGRWWTSIAVLPQHGGQGYGKAIMADTIRRHDGTVWSEARLDNPAAMKIHPPEDWELISQDERLAHFRSIQ
jgi:GNAT superfamily N-acetyltransferase